MRKTEIDRLGKLYRVRQIWKTIDRQGKQRGRLGKQREMGETEIDKWGKLRERWGKLKVIDWENYTVLERFVKHQIDRKLREVDWENRER